MLYFLFLLMGIVPLPFMMNGELFPEECKSAAASLSTATAWLGSFAVSKTVVNLQAVLGYSGTYFLYGTFCTLGTVYIFFGVPETKGKTPEEILQYFRVGQRQVNHYSKGKEVIHPYDNQAYVKTREGHSEGNVIISSL